MKRCAFIKKAILTGAAVCGASQFEKPAIAKGIMQCQKDKQHDQKAT